MKTLKRSVFGENTTNTIASRNRMYQTLQDFQSLSQTGQLKYLYEGAGFYHPVERERYNVTLLILTMEKEI